MGSLKQYKKQNVKGVNCNFNLTDENLYENLAPSRNVKCGCSEGNFRRK